MVYVIEFLRRIIILTLKAKGPQTPPDIFQEPRTGNLLGLKVASKIEILSNKFAAKIFQLLHSDREINK